MKIMNNRKALLLLTAVVLVMAVSVGGTLAYLSMKTGPVVNTFEPAKVDIAVDESENTDTVKQNVKITNKSDSINAYIRAMVVVTWQKANDVIPAKEGDYTLSYGSGWTENGGFYYWPGVVAPGESTGVLIETAQPTAGKAPTGYSLHVEVLAQAIQADGMNASSAVDAFTKAAQ